MSNGIGIVGLEKKYFCIEQFWTVSINTRGRHFIIACTKHLHANICCYDKSRLLG